MTHEHLLDDDEGDVVDYLDEAEGRLFDRAQEFEQSKTHDPRWPQKESFDDFDE